MSGAMSAIGTKRTSIVHRNVRFWGQSGHERFACTCLLLTHEERVDRRLAAIFAADIAGYSRLMGADEEGTLRQLKAHRKELVDPKITEHRGRIVKTTGDGVLVEFVSVVDAVRCAVDIQRGMLEREQQCPC